MCAPYDVIRAGTSLETIGSKGADPNQAGNINRIPALARQSRDIVNVRLRLFLLCAGSHIHRQRNNARGPLRHKRRHRPKASKLRK